MSMYKLWEGLGKPDKQFRQWASSTIDRAQLVEGQDFTPGEYEKRAWAGGHITVYKGKDYLLTTDAVTAILSTLPRSLKSKALLYAQMEIVKRLAAGDEQLVRYGIGRMENPQVLSDLFIRAWSARISGPTMRLRIDIENTRPDGYWSPLWENPIS